MSDTLDDIRKNNIIDSRDIINAIEYWQDIIDGQEGYSMDEIQEAQDNLEELEEFAEPFEDYEEWNHGATLINESYFTYYCEELTKDCGYINSDLPSWIAIDWEKTAENLSPDYIQDNGYYMLAG